MTTPLETALILNLKRNMLGMETMGGNTREERISQSACKAQWPTNHFGLAHS